MKGTCCSHRSEMHWLLWQQTTPSYALRRVRLAMPAHHMMCQRMAGAHLSPCTLTARAAGVWVRGSQANHSHQAGSAARADPALLRPPPLPTDLARRHTSGIGDKAEAAVVQAPSLNSFLPGARSAALPAGSTLAALAHRMGSQDDSNAPVTAPGGIQAMAVEGGGVSGATWLGIEAKARTPQARMGEGGFWQAFTGWQYGAP